MAIFKCKMCGGTLEVNQGESTGVCEYCGTKQTLPRLDDEKRVQLYDRANYFRRANEYDKAMGIYEMILSEDKEDSEAYWSIVLCKYGIEYVEDPRSGKRIPTVNRAQYTSICDDKDYLSALNYADDVQKEVYMAEAKTIDTIQRGILEISAKEEPFDVFICYKETGADGERTPDSVYAQDIYNALVKEGYKVFFSRITLESKLGQQYEPYIFAALHSAKAMLVIGTRKEYFEAVWVKNEWARFLALAKADESKILIPCYKDISPYDMPEEFTYLQSQDIGKIGFMQDLLHGISKVVKKEPAVKETAVGGNSAGVAPLLKRASMFLEDGDWQSADEYCEKVLDLDPENAEAYLGKLMAELQVRTVEEIGNKSVDFSQDTNYKKICRFGDEQIVALVNKQLNQYQERIRKKYKQKLESLIYLFDTTTDMKTMQNIKYEFSRLVNVFPEAKEYVEKCDEKIELLNPGSGKLIIKFNTKIRDKQFYIKVSGKAYPIGIKNTLDTMEFDLPAGEHVLTSAYFTKKYAFRIERDKSVEAKISRNLVGDYILKFEE